VLNASWLGIYGNCVIVDHAWACQSLYGHLSSFSTSKSATRYPRPDRRPQRHDGHGGRPDHLHFTMLVNGRIGEPPWSVDPHWMKMRDAKTQGMMVFYSDQENQCGRNI